MATRSLTAFFADHSEAELTVMAQTIDPLNSDDFQLFLRFFPFSDVNSTKVGEITDFDFRPTATRREWNAPGQYIPLKTPSFKEMEFTPIEAYYKWDEQAINRISNQVMGNEALIRQIIKEDVPGRTMALALSVWRRALVDAFTAWANGTVSIRNPQTGTSYTVSYGMDSSRYVTAGTAWNDVSINGYDAFLAAIDAAEAKIGPVAGVVMRRATQNAILADAPNLPNSVDMTRSRLADRISEDTGRPFEFLILENTADVFTDGGTATTSTNIWPSQKVGFIPAGDQVGRTARAPVRRAGLLVPGLSPDQFDERGVTMFLESHNSGKEMEEQGQANWCPLPNEQKVYVVNAGV